MKEKIIECCIRILIIVELSMVRLGQESMKVMRMKCGSGNASIV